MWTLRDLDPAYDGQPVVFFGQGALFLNNFYFGGGSGSASFYGKSRTLSKAHFDYGGFLVGYRYPIAPLVRIGAQLLLGGGELRLESGRTIELDERFYCLVPEFALGVTPSRWLLLEARLGYFGALGSSTIAPLRKPQFALSAVFGTN
ncbi:MAG: hypothetical protein RML47_06670 [Bacteroidota bacterium]|nr:hypothetical protein [Rhodothermia bacterium]MDW8285769.1 hypothetical protein [Bacteroidota bacterium]